MEKQDTSEEHNPNIFEYIVVGGLVTLITGIILIALALPMPKEWKDNIKVFVKSTSEQGESEG